jgi:hypothetical protein
MLREGMPLPGARPAYPCVVTPIARAAAAGLAAVAVLGTAGAGCSAPPASRPAATAAGSIAAGSTTAGSSSPSPTRILLTPTTTPATSQVVSWSMPRRERGQRVEVRIAGSTAVSAVPAVRRPATTVRSSGTDDPRYAATLTGLRPDTRHEYRIRTAGGATGWRAFTTAGPATQPLTIVGLGDTQVDNRGVPRATIRAAMAAVPDADLVLQAGDVVDRPYRDRQWRDLFAAIGESGRTRTWIVSIGNHEQCVLVRLCRSGNAQAFRSYFDWPSNGVPGQGETWFFTDYQGVRIVVLDTFGGRLADQARFLDRALASNPHDWSIVLMHAPPFASRPGRTNPEVRDLLWPVLEARGADLVLTGHDHAYARGQQDPGGPVVVTSVSGPKYYPTSGADWAANGAERAVAAEQTSTYQVITVDGDRLDYRAVVTHRGPGSTSPVGVGATLDRFTITQAADGSPMVR